MKYNVIMQGSQQFPCENMTKAMVLQKKKKVRFHIAHNFQKFVDPLNPSMGLLPSSGSQAHS